MLIELVMIGGAKIANDWTCTNRLFALNSNKLWYERTKEAADW